MSIKSSYPSVRPTLDLNFAATKKLDNRITFARNTTAYYYTGDTIKTAQNNLKFSSQINSTNWNLFRNTLSTGHYDPFGTQTAIKLTGDGGTGTSTGAYRTTIGHDSANGNYTLSVYAKADQSSYVYVGTNNGNTKAGHFNLSNGTAINNPGAGGTSNIVDVGGGWYRISITIDASSHSPDNFFIFGLSGATGGENRTYTTSESAFFFGPQWEIGDSATVYTPTTTTSSIVYEPELSYVVNNAPRFDHDPDTGESLGLLLEETRTNYMNRSSNFVSNNNPWNALGTWHRVDNLAIAPDGTQTADFLRHTSGNILRAAFNSGDASGANWKTFSVWLKGANGGETFTIDIGDRGSTSFTLTTKWKRYFVSTNDAGNGDFVDFSTPGNCFYAWGAQLEANKIPTSYIPTDGASASRLYDNAYIAGAANFDTWFNPAEGTIVGEADRGSDGTEGAGIGAFRRASGSYHNMIQFAELYDSNTGYIGRTYYQGGAQNAPALISGNSSGAGIFNKYAYAYKENDFNGAHNGTASTTDTAGRIPTLIDRFIFGGYNDDRSNQNLDGHIKYLTYYPQRLSNDELEGLTS